jgi:hypothetical protein
MTMLPRRFAPSGASAFSTSTSPNRQPLQGGKATPGKYVNRNLNRGGSKAADVADSGEDLVSEQVADPMQLGQRAAVDGSDGGGDLGGGGDAPIQPADLSDQVTGRSTQGLRHGGPRAHHAQQLSRLLNTDNT